MGQYISNVQNSQAELARTQQGMTNLGENIAHINRSKLAMRASVAKAIQDMYSTGVRGNVDVDESGIAHGDNDYNEGMFGGQQQAMKDSDRSQELKQSYNKTFSPDATTYMTKLSREGAGAMTQEEKDAYSRSLDYQKDRQNAYASRVVAVTAAAVTAAAVTAAAVTAAAAANNQNNNNANSTGAGTGTRQTPWQGVPFPLPSQQGATGPASSTNAPNSTPASTAPSANTNTTAAPPAGSGGGQSNTVKGSARLTTGFEYEGGHANIKPSYHTESSFEPRIVDNDPYLRSLEKAGLAAQTNINAASIMSGGASDRTNPYANMAESRRIFLKDYMDRMKEQGTRISDEIGEVDVTGKKLKVSTGETESASTTNTFHFHQPGSATPKTKDPLLMINLPNGAIHGLIPVPNKPGTGYLPEQDNYIPQPYSHASSFLANKLREKGAEAYIYRNGSNTPEPFHDKNNHLVNKDGQPMTDPTTKNANPGPFGIDRLGDGDELKFKDGTIIRRVAGESNIQIFADKGKKVSTSARNFQLSGGSTEFTNIMKNSMDTAAMKAAVIEAAEKAQQSVAATCDHIIDTIDNELKGHPNVTNADKAEIQRLIDKKAKVVSIRKY